MSVSIPTKPGDQVRCLPKSHPTAEDRQWRKKRKSAKTASLRASFRAAELNRHFTQRYGDVIPGVVEDVELMLNVLALTRNPSSRIRKWLAWRAPWYDDEDAIFAIMAKPVWLTPDGLARKINLSASMRQQLKIKTIGAKDQSKKMREAIREQNKTIAKRKKRRAAGMQPRHEWEAQRLTRQQPWVAMGISRPTWYRKHWKPAPPIAPEIRDISVETGLTPMTLYINGDRPVSNSSVREKRTVSRREHPGLTIVSSL